MPEPLKNLYTRELINQLTDCINNQLEGFDKSAFVHAILDNSWAALELKQRMHHITLALHQFLPDEFERALPILVHCSRKFNGFQSMFFPQYVELYGQHHFKLSMSALEVMTQYSSSELAIRPFIIHQPEKAMAQMTEWSLSNNFHVRRLSSEGCRPRLPWAMALPEFKKNPSPIIPILQNLKNDTSEYVRRSVANNLNDISKDNPDITLNLCKQWHGHSIQTDRLIKHACRTLLKNAEPEALKLFGYRHPGHITLSDFYYDDQVEMGESLNFSFQLTSESKLGLCRIEYKIHFQKANTTLSPKVFKISESDVTQSQKFINKKHSFRPITTRRYHPGLHKLEILVNGCALATTDFNLV